MSKSATKRIGFFIVLNSIKIVRCILGLGRMNGKIRKGYNNWLDNASTSENIVENVEEFAF